MMRDNLVAEAPRLSVLVVAYQSRAFLETCIGSVIAHTSAPIEILVIDNGTDGGGAAVTQRFAEVRAIASEGNIGFGAGNNRLAAAARAPYLLLLNPDTRVEDDAIDRLLAFATSRPDAVAWGGRTVSPAGHPDSGNHIVIPTLGALARLVLGDGSGMRAGGLADDAREPAPVDVLCGGFMMIRTDVWRAFGGFDETFFLYSEEVDLFVRLKAAGHVVLATPDSAIVHDVGSGEALSPTRTFYRTVGQMQFARKHWRGPSATVAAALIWTAAAQRFAYGLALGWRKPRAAAMRRAYEPIALRPSRWWLGYDSPGSDPRGLNEGMH